MKLRLALLALAALPLSVSAQPYAGKTVTIIVYRTDEPTQS